jgi:hypothetical protein
MAIAPTTPTEIPAIWPGARTVDGAEVGVEVGTEVDVGDGSELVVMLFAIDEELEWTVRDGMLVLALVLKVVHVDVGVDDLDSVLDDVFDDAVCDSVVCVSVGGGNRVGAPVGGTTKVAVSTECVFGKALACPLHILSTLAGAASGDVSLLRSLSQQRISHLTISVLSGTLAQLDIPKEALQCSLPDREPRDRPSWTQTLQRKIFSAVYRRIVGSYERQQA